MAVRIIGEYINLFTLSMNHEKKILLAVSDKQNFYDKEKQNQSQVSIFVPTLSG